LCRGDRRGGSGGLLHLDLWGVNEKGGRFLLSHGETTPFVMRLDTGLLLGQDEDFYLSLESVTEVFGIFDAAGHPRAVVHRNGYLGPDLLGGLDGLVGGHDVRAAHWQQSDVDLDVVHLRDEVGVTGVVDAFVSHGENETDVTG
jgi:hypothetical protein